MAESLKSKTVKGVTWSAIDNVAQFSVSFVVGIVLARILSPDDYGLLGIIAIFTAICTTIINGGFSTALIRKKEANDIDLSTTFWVNLLISLLLFGIICFCAPFIGKFFGREELIALIPVSSVELIIGALSLVQQTILVRKIDFKTQTKITLAASIVSGVVGIVMAYIGFGVWALVAQRLASQTLRTILLWLYNKWIPKLKFSMESFHDLFNFGWKISASSLIDTVWREIYQVIIGKFYQPVTLGYYTRAQQFSGMFSSNLTSVVQRVSFPVLSSIQDNSERLRDAYKRIIKVTMLVTFLLMIGLASISKAFVLTLIGEKWLPCVPMLQLLCLNMMLYPLHALNLNMLQVKGRSDLYLKIEIAKKIIAIIPILVGVFIGIYEMLICSVITGLISYYINAYYSGILIGYSFRDQVIDILPSFIIAIVMGLIVFVIGYVPLPFYLILLIQMLCGFLVALLLCEKLGITEYYELKKMAENKIYRNKRSR